jgi:hypothetical protein
LSWIPEEDDEQAGVQKYLFGIRKSRRENWGIYAQKADISGQFALRRSLSNAVPDTRVSKRRKYGSVEILYG